MSAGTATHVQTPKLRDTVSLVKNEKSLTFMLGEREITFSFLGDSEYEQGEAFSLELSAGGASRDSLLTKYPGLPI